MQSKFARALATVAVLLTGAGLTAAPAAAQQDIPWTWNSNDHDVRGRFEATGEKVLAREYHGRTYIDYQRSSRWWIPGSHTGAMKTLNLSYPEGKAFKFNVCQHHENFPDDCSGWRYGAT